MIQMCPAIVDRMSPIIKVDIEIPLLAFSYFTNTAMIRLTMSQIHTIPVRFIK